MTAAMEQHHVQSADEARQRIAAGTHDRLAFRAALLAAPRDARDAWLDRVLGLGALPDDGPELPRGCVPYMPCGVDALLEVVDRAEVGPTDVFVDIGSGVGRATALVHLLTGAAVIGIEVQAALVQVARDLARVVSSSISTVLGDAVELAGRMPSGSVFFLYCPFSGARLQRLLGELETIAQTRPIRVCCVDLPLPARAWLVADPATTGSVTVYRSVYEPADEPGPGSARTSPT